MRVRLGAAALLLLAVLTGCSDSKTDTAQTPPPAGDVSPGADGRVGNTGGPSNVAVPDPCVLITQDEAAKAMGVTIDGTAIPPAGGLPGQRSCGYANSASATSIQIAVWPADTASFASVKGLASTAGAVQDVSGLGDAAFLAPGAIFVHKGSLAVSISLLQFGDDAAAKPVLTSLATTAVGRL